MRSAGRGGFDEFLSAMDWLVLQLGGRSTYTENEWPIFAMAGLLPGPYWPLLWAQVEDCARCAVRVGGLRRISGRDELASAAVGGAKHVHAKRVVEFCDG